MNHANCRRHKNGINKLFDLNRFDEWFEATYQPVNCGNVPIPKVITFKEHIRILKERDNQYASLLNEYNDLVESFNKLQKAYCDATGERYIEEEEEQEKKRMTIKKCDACGNIYEKGYIFAYSLDPYEVNKANAQAKFGYAPTKDLCENCANRLKMFLLPIMVKDKVKK